MYYYVDTYTTDYCQHIIKTILQVQAHLQFTQAIAQPKIAKELPPLPPEKNYFLKSPSLLNILKTQSHNPTQNQTDI